MFIEVCQKDVFRKRKYNLLTSKYKKQQQKRQSKVNKTLGDKYWNT